MKYNKYQVNEVFASIQGEGGMMGTPAVFIRFAGCNLRCPFCDTDFEDFTARSLGWFRSELNERPERWVILTGGEPLLQVDRELIDTLHNMGFKVGVETNGTVFSPLPFDYITLSPKNVPLDGLWRSRVVNEVRCPIAVGDPLPVPPTVPSVADRYYLSPIFDGMRPIPANIEYAINMARDNPPWKVSVQLHKLIGVK